MQPFDLRSEDLSEILGTPPGWLVRWGTIVIFFAFSLLVAAGWMIRYPDVISADVVFTTAMPPVEVVARTEGHLEKLFVKEDSPVQSGDILAVLQNTARYEDVLALNIKVQAWSNASTDDSLLLIAPLAGNPELGEIRNDYASFLQQLEAYKFSRKNKTSATTANIGTVQQQIAQAQRGIQLDRSSQQKAATQLQISKQHLELQKKLLDDGLIATQEYDRSRAQNLDAERQYDLYTDAVLRKQSEISGLQRSIGIVRFDENLDNNSAAGRLRASLSTLRTSLDQWKQNYLLTAPIGGLVSLNKFYSEQQYVKQGEHVMTVVPPTDTKIIGRSLLPIAGSGKVKTNQRVVIKLDNYPYYEFGTLSGIVLSKSSVPKDNQYAVTIGLDSLSGTTTNYGRTITFQQQLQGKADIITADRRFLQRIVDQLFASAR